jgi:hypothetical protein
MNWIDVVRSKRRLALLCLLWFGVAAAFFFWRSREPLVWCDTVLVAHNLFEEPEPLKWGNPGTLAWITQNSFSIVGMEGYRPLSRMVLWAGVALFSNPKFNPHVWFAAGGVVIGAMALCFFLVARRFLQSDISSLFAVFLFLFSAPVVTGALNMSCGFQAIVPLMICLGLLLYWRTVERAENKVWYGIGLIAILIFAPWFREFVGLLPLLIIFLEAQRARGPTVLMGVAGLCFIHAIYPTALVKWLSYPNLEIQPIFAMGHLGVKGSVALQDTGSFIFRLLSEMTVRAAPLHFLTLYPPILFILAFIAVLLPLWDGRPSVLGQLSLMTRDYIQLRSVKINRNCLASLIFLGATIAICVSPQDESSSLLWVPVLAFWVCFGFGLLALRRDVFLAWWFLLSFVPFLKLFTEQVHLAYCLLPASIIIVAALEEMWPAMQRLRGVIRYAFLTALFVATADHFLNPFNSYRVVHSINEGISKVALWFRSSVPPGSIVVSNALHAEDIRLFSDGHVKVYWTVQSGIPRVEDTVAEPRVLEELLKENHGKRNVYFLDVDFDYTLDKANYHFHKYVRNRSVDMKEIGLVHITQVRYPFIDVIKTWVTRSYISFLGAPDLENDFYRGPAQNGAPFTREVYAEYRVYRVIGTKVDLWDPAGAVQMAQEGYRGFNILELNARYFGIPQGEGAFDLQKVRKKMYSKSFVADGYDEILRQIDGSIKKERGAAQSDLCESLSLRGITIATLIEEGYRGYNIIEYGGRIYAIPQGEGAFAIDRIQRNEYKRWFSSCSLNAIREQIDESVQKK